MAHITFTRVGDCGGCRFLVIGQDGRGVYGSETPCGTCERNPRVILFLSDRKEKQETPRLPPGSLVPHPGDPVSELDKDNDGFFAEHGLRRRPRK